MKIAFFRMSSGYGGAERLILKTAIALANRGHQVIVISSCRKLIEEAAEVKITVRELWSSPEPTTNRQLLFYLLYYPLNLFQIWRALNGLSGHVLYFHSLAEKLIGTNLAKRKGLKVVWFEHGPSSYWIKPLWVRKWYQRSGRLACRIVANSESTKNDITQHFPSLKGKIVVIAPGFVPPEDYQAPKRVTAGFIGSLTKEKGIEVFLRAVRELSKKDSTLQVVIVGEGPYQELVKKTCRKYGWSYHGQTNNLYSKLKGLSVLIVPSLVPEGFGMVAAQALLAGVPVVATDAGGLREIVVPGQSGLLVPMNDVKALTVAMERILSSPERARQMGMWGRSDILRRYPFKKMIIDTERVLEHD